MNIMKLVSSIFFVTLLLLGSSLSAADRVLPKDDGRSDFYQALSEHFRVPESVIVAVHDRKISDDDLGVVFFLAKAAGIRPDDVIDLRQLRKSWMELTLHFGLNPEIFYFPLTADPAPPLAKAYAKYKKLPRTEWKKVVLEDDEIVNLVNLRFVSLYYRITPEEIIRLRAENRNYLAIAREISSPEYKARMAVSDKKVRPHLREPIKKSS